MSSEGKAKKNEKTRNKKEKRERKDKTIDQQDDKDERKVGSKKDVSSKDGKQKTRRKSVSFSDSYRFDPQYKDECVQDALRLVFEGLEVHIKDLAIYPRVVAHAVSKTVAQMVQMLCYSNVNWMHTWEDLEGRADEEWKLMSELHLPPIDTWARAVIPLKLSSIPITFLKPVRSNEGQFQSLADPGACHGREELVPRLIRRASDTSVARTVKKCNHCLEFDRNEGNRRATDSPETNEKQRKKLLQGLRRRLSPYIRDQALLAQMLREKGLLDGSDTVLELDKKVFWLGDR